jgi:hypothetical protein
MACRVAKDTQAESDEETIRDVWADVINRVHPPDPHEVEAAEMLLAALEDPVIMASLTESGDLKITTRNVPDCLIGQACRTCKDPACKCPCHVKIKVQLQDENGNPLDDDGNPLKKE